MHLEITQHPHDMKVHLLFEQSGVFKRSWTATGYEAIDYDINNDYGQTDVQLDIMEEVKDCYWALRKTIFDDMATGDLVMAFFPCIYFAQWGKLNLHPGCPNNALLTKDDRWKKIIDRAFDRDRYLIALLQLIAICDKQSLPLIVENPWSGAQYLREALPWKPMLIDTNRAGHGDYYKKPTAYWFFGIKPKDAMPTTRRKYDLTIERAKKSIHKGMCSGERCEISQEYADAFVRWVILGKQQTIFNPIFY